MENSVVCQVCCDVVYKYKCPACLIKYCSVPCYKSHKDGQCHSSCAKESTSSSMAAEQDVTCNEADSRSHSEQHLKSMEVDTAMLQFPTEHTVHPDLLLKLRDSTELRTQLESPTLRDMLTELAASDEPCSADLLLDRWIKESKQFRQFAEVCLEVVEKPDLNTFRETNEEILERVLKSNRK